MQREAHTLTEQLIRKIEILAPSLEPSERIPSLCAPAPDTEPFSEQRCAVLSRLSQMILAESFLKSDPASVALAYWLRRSHIQTLKEQFLRKTSIEDEVVFIPAGNVLHITPANVDTFFVYSWALSFLCGNSNIVRLSSTQFPPVVEHILGCIDNLMQQGEDVGRSNWFITYQHDTATTEALSQWCNHRIIWGGNKTTQAVRSLSLNAHASERLFGTKFSYSVFSAQRICHEQAERLKILASDFFNDVFWFDQMACSSPHIIFWVGDKSTVHAAIARLNDALDREVSRRRYVPTTSNALKRLDFAFNSASQQDIRVDLHHPGFINLHAPDQRALHREICGGGVLTHIQIDHLQQVVDFACQQDQTISHFGFTAAEISQFAKLVGMKGVDRVVPVGRALAFSANWDGYDLISDFLRRVVVQL